MGRIVSPRAGRYPRSTLRAKPPRAAVAAADVALAAGILVLAAAGGAQASPEQARGDPVRVPRISTSHHPPAAPGHPRRDERRRHGYAVWDRASYEREKKQADAESGPSPEGSAPQAAPLLPAPSPGWEGIDDPSFAPSDSTGAIGPTRYVELVNSSFAIYDRSGSELASGSLSALTGNPSAGLGDPQVIWDPDTNRFYYAMHDFESSTYEYGFSKSASPSSASDWCAYNLDYDFGFLFPDYIKLGDTADFVLFGVNVFGLSDVSAEVDWITKPSGTGTITTCPDPSAFDLGFVTGLQSPDGMPGFTPVPANQIDGSRTGWIVSSNVFARDSLTIWPVTKAPDGTASIPTAGTAVPVSSFGVPANAVQPGTSVRLDSLDARLTQAVSAVDPANGSETAIWTQHTVRGGKGAEVRWYEIDADSAALFQSGKVTSSSLYVFNGAISPDRVNTGSATAFGANMALGFNTSSGSEFPSIRMVRKMAGQPQSAMRLVKAGTGSFVDCLGDSVCRWGDYSAATPDPAADTGGSFGAVWLTNMWTAGGDVFDWRTWNWKAVLVNPPAISGFTPSGVTGSNVVIIGMSFLGATSVTFDGVPSPRFTVDSDTQITAEVPRAATSGKIAVTTDDGTAESATDFSVTPTIRSFGPRAAKLGRLVTVNGTGLAGAVEVIFDGVSAGPPAILSPTRVRVAVPALATSGPVGVEVEGGGAATSTDSFTVRPAVTGFSVPSGVWGDTITIMGGGFSGATAVMLGGVVAPGFTVVDPSQIQVAVPTGAATARVKVITPVGSATSPARFLVEPGISGFSPGSGPPATAVTIDGTAFIGVSAVRFNGVKAWFKVLSPTQITAKVPAAATSGPITVTTKGGTATSAGPFTVT